MGVVYLGRLVESRCELSWVEKKKTEPRPILRCTVAEMRDQKERNEATKLSTTRFARSIAARHANDPVVALVRQARPANSSSNAPIISTVITVQ